MSFGLTVSITIIVYDWGDTSISSYEGRRGAEQSGGLYAYLTGMVGGGVIRPPKKATLRVSTMSPISVAKAERALECCLLMRKKGKFKFATRSRLFVFGVGTTAKEGV